jgi:hypothetical protein
MNKLRIKGILKIRLESMNLYDSLSEPYKRSYIQLLDLGIKFTVSVTVKCKYL